MKSSNYTIQNTTLADKPHLTTLTPSFQSPHAFIDQLHLQLT